MNKYEEMQKKLKDNDVCYLYENGKLVHKIKLDESIKMFAKFQGYLTYREYEFPFSFHLIDVCDLNRFEILTKEEVNQKYGECKMNKFEENINKFESLKNSNKLAYLKSENVLVRVDEIKRHSYSNEAVFIHKIGICYGNYKVTKESDFQILNEEEYLKENVKNIEKRLKEIEEEKKPKIEIGKTYVIRNKKDPMLNSLVYVSDITNDLFYTHNKNKNRWYHISDFDFQEVDISIKEFFENMPQKYWKE